MLERTGKDYGLAAAVGHGGSPTRAVIEQLEDPCTGDMTCRCSKCQAAVSALVKRGPRGAGHQPWNVKAA